MKIRYSLTRWDLFRSNLGAIFHQRSLVVLVCVMLIILGWIGFTAGDEPERSTLVRLVGMLITMSIGFMAMVAITIIHLGMIVLVRKHRGVLGEHVLEAGDEGFRETTAFNSTLVKWNGLLRIRRSANYALIYVTEAQAHTIPLRARLAEGDVDGFLAEVQKRMKSAQPGATDNPDDAQRI